MNLLLTRIFRRGCARERGVALLVVLSILALLIVLVLGFFSSITSDTVASAHYASASNARRIADSGLGMVMSQIQLATSGTGGITWTSQPGMLRSFGTDGNAKEVFKLYSAESLRASAADYKESDDAASDWKDAAWPGAICADINQPVVSASGALVYPIVDPRAAQDNAATGRKAVSGFQVGSAPGYQSGVDAAPENNPAAMPVKWLYILEDGRVAVPQLVDENGSVTFSPNGVAPSESNPVVGRVAFWTDDDTCKLNVNTAGYGFNSDTYWTYWDTPYCFSQDEETFLSKNQPWKGEYQRYPGHPATTSLHTVFPELDKFDLFKVTPRFYASDVTNGAGSDGGTVVGTSLSKMQVKQDRLYASVDELLFSPDRNANLGALTNADLDAKRFFLSAHSRSPDLNLFGQPRVTIWPEPVNAAARTQLDKLIAFCASTPQEQFYFVRKNPMSTTEDFNAGNNAKLYQYLQRMTGRQIPGFGGPAQGFASASKYGGDRDQILTSIFDTIRLTNLCEKAPAVPYTSNDNSGQIMGLVLPTENPNGTRGAGRTMVIKEADIVFVSMGCTTGTSVTASSTSSVVMGMLFDFWQPAAGAVAGGANFNYTVEGLDSFTISGKTTAASGTNTEIRLFPGRDTWTHSLREYRFSAVYGGANPQVTSMSGTATSGAGTSSSCSFALPPTSDLLSLTGTGFKFNGGTVTVTIRAPKENTTGDYLQKYTLVFPPIDALPMPKLGPSSAAWSTDSTPAFAPVSTRPGRFSVSTGSPLIMDADVARGIQLMGKDTTSGQFVNGDVRLLAHWKDVPVNMFAPADKYYDQIKSAHGLRRAGGYMTGGAKFGNLIQGFVPAENSTKPDIPSGIDGVRNSKGATGDWDNGPGFLADGPYLPKPDEGVIYTPGNPSEGGYFCNDLIDKSTFKGNLETLFSANRQVPSAGIFGSIPTGVKRGLPWQTLLFRPARAYHPGGTNHPGAEDPPDYLLLDLFQMPVVEPYAISEPFSTAGKVNMNYRIKPFGYIKRDTAVRSVLESVKMTAIPEDALGAGYLGYNTHPAYPYRTRFNVDAVETLKQFEDRFDAGVGKRVFVSEAEICSLDLVPDGTSINNLQTFWNNKRTTGDNSRERPYALLYPRLTTKSNTYTVYVTAQSLKCPATYRGGWNEKRGAVVGEWRGEFAIERYVDPNDPEMPTFLSQDGDLSKRYRFRTVNTKRFDP